jgi:hypothetical protein
MKKKNIDPMDLKTVTRWYLLAALFVLILFQLLFKSESTLSYIGEILSGLITMYGIYYAFADSERTRDIENKPRLSAAVSPVPASDFDKANRVFTYFAGGNVCLPRHLQFTLRNEGSTEINITGLFVGKTDKQNNVHWLPYKTYQLAADTTDKKQNLVLLNENLDLNASLQLRLDVSERIPDGPGTEAPQSEKTKNRFFVEVWYKNDYSDTYYAKKYAVEHIPLERYTSDKEAVWDQSLDCHAYTAEEKTKRDFEQKASAAEQYIQSVLSHFAEEKKNDHEKDAEA